MNIRRLPGHSHPDEDDHLTVDNTYMVLITDLKTIKKICEGQQRLIGLFWFYCPARGDSRYLYLKYSWGVCSRRHLSITINGRIIRHYRVLKSSIVRWIDGWMDVWQLNKKIDNNGVTIGSSQSVGDLQEMRQ